MKKLLLNSIALSAAFSAAPQLMALEALDDEGMSSITGQSGITLTQSSDSVTLGQVSYTDDGTSLILDNLNWTASPGNTSFDRTTTIDTTADGQLQIESTGSERTLNIDAITLSGETDNFMGIQATYDDYTRLNIANDGSGNTDFSGSQFDINFANLMLSDDNYDWIFTDLTLSVLVNYGRLVAEPSALLLDFGTDTNRGLSIEYGFSGIGLDLDNSFDPQVGLTSAYGSLDLVFDMYGSLRMRGGGNTGTEGITFIPSLILINDDHKDGDSSNDTLAFIYEDDGFVMLAEDFTASFDSVNGLTLDLESDAESSYLALRVEDLEIAFSADNLVIGGTKADYEANKNSPDFQSIGGVSGFFRFENGLVNIDGSNVFRENYLFLRPGGLEGDGISADIGWNIVSDDPVSETDALGSYNRPGNVNSFISLEDDGNLVYLNGFNSWGSGRVQLDLTRQADNLGSNPGNQSGANGLYSSVYGQAGGYDGYFDGLRITFDNVVGSYSFDGVTVGTSAQEAAAAPLQGGTELLLALEIFPAYDFTLNGSLTFLPGDPNPGDNQGFTLNGDLYATDANAALTVDENGRGIWLTDTSYEIHMRDASFTVDENGLTFNKGLTWSKISVGDILFGDKDTGQSLGQFELERLEDGTSLSIASGGAGAVCIGGSLNAAGDACDAGGGRFEDRGDQGITIKLKMKFAQDDGSDPRYQGKGTRFLWTQTNGTVLGLENFSTSDGPGTDTNDYGLNVDLSVDVARTAVRNASGDLIDSDGNVITESQIATDGPLGFAVLGEVHFKQLNIDNVTLAATPTETPQTLVDAVILQNGSIQTNLTATPIR